MFRFPIRIVHLMNQLQKQQRLSVLPHISDSLQTHHIGSCFISSCNTVKDIKLTSALLYSPQDVIELGGDAWDGSQGRIWLIIKQH